MEAPCTSRSLAAALALATVLVLGLVLVAPAAALEQKLTVEDGAAGSKLGNSVAIEGDTAVVGAPAANDGRGAVYVFARFGNSWTQTAKLTASDGAPADHLGDSLALDGDTIVAGAPDNDVGTSRNQGSIYTFTRTGGAARTETAKLTASGGAADDNFGFSVALDGDTIVAGAPRDDIEGRFVTDVNRGSIYTFARSGAAARPATAHLIAGDGADGDELGWSVALDGDTIVAGAPGVSDSQGAAYTFARTGDRSRSDTAKLTAADGAAVDRLGSSVAIAGDTIVAGAPNHKVGANENQGSAYTFARSGGAARTGTAKLTASDGAAGDSFGDSVAAAGDTIAAGARLDDIGGRANQGSTYTFARTGPAERKETAKLTAADGGTGDQLGNAVAMAGDAIVAGAPLDQVGANRDQGSASIFFAPAPLRPATPPGRPGPPGLMSGACANGKRGTSAADALAGTPAGDAIFGLGGRDLLSGLAGDDCLLGGSDADRLLGGPDEDRLQGDRGNDVAAGGAGRDRLLGGDGKDRLSGESGNDTLVGGSGNDTLTGGGGRNGYSAGSGNDTVNARNRQRERVDCGPGRDRATVDRSDRVRRCERVRRR